MNLRSPQIAYWTLLGVVAAVGMSAIHARIEHGLQVTNLTSLVPWGLWVALYIYFIGLSAGSFLLSTLIYVFGQTRFERVGRLALFVAFVALVAGLAFIWLDLGHPERFWTVFLHRNPASVLEWEIHLYVLYAVVLLAELWLVMRPDLVRGAQQRSWRGRLYRLLALGSTDVSETALSRDRRAVRVLGLLGVPVAIGVHGGTGAIFAVVKARPFWYSGLVPVIFLVSALASGGAALTCLTAFSLKGERHRDLVRGLARLVTAFLALDVLCLASEMLVGLYGGVPDHVATYRAMLFGPFWYVFWILQVGLGTVAPLVILLHPRTGQSRGWIGLATALVAIGIVGVRLNIIIPPLTVPLLPGLETAYPLGRFSTFTWSPAGWLLLAVAVGVFVAAAGLLATWLASQPVVRWQRWAAQGVSLVVLTGFVVVGLRFLHIGTPTGAWLLGEPTPLPLFFGGTVRTTDPNLYVPSDLEWFSSAGVIALAAAFFSLGWCALPLRPSEESLVEGGRTAWRGQHS
jgi:Ni/Fe-hydrogenase subunit HybB-like protein